MVWWQGASLLGRWDSNQSGPPGGASDTGSSFLIAPRPVDSLSRCSTCSERDWCRRASCSPQHMNDLIGQMEAWMRLYGPYGKTSARSRGRFLLHDYKWLNPALHHTGMLYVSHCFPDRVTELRIPSSRKCLISPTNLKKSINVLCGKKGIYCNIFVLCSSGCALFPNSIKVVFNSFIQELKRTWKRHFT